MSEPKPNNDELFARALDYVYKVKARFVNQPEKYFSFCQELTQTIEDTKVVELDDQEGGLLMTTPDGALDRIKVVLEGHEDLILGLNQFFLPDNVKKTGQQETNKKRVVESLVEEEDRTKRLRTCVDLNATPLSCSGLVSPVQARCVDAKSQGLDGEKVEGNYCVMEEDEIDEEGRQFYSFLMKVLEKMSDSERCVKFMKHCNNYSLGLISKQELGFLVEREIGNWADLMEEFKLNLEHYYGNEAKCFLRETKKQVKIRKRDLEFSERAKNCEEERATPSYLLVHGLKRDYCVSKPPSNYRPKPKVITRQEQVMFEAEDQEYGREILLEWLRSSCDYLREIKETDALDERIGIFTKIVFRRCVERMYGDYADDVLDMFYKDCKGMAQMILDRMEQKAKELRQYKQESSQGKCLEMS